MIILGLTSLAVVILLAFLIYKSNAAFIFKLSAVFILSALLLFGAKYYYDRLGTPIIGYPTGEFTYMHHVIMSNKRIELWIFTKANGSKLYSFPMDSKIAKKLEETKKQQKKSQMKGKFLSDGTGHPNSMVFKSRPSGIANGNYTK